MTVIPPRTAAQKRRVLRRPELSSTDVELLEATNSRVHPYDDMYNGDGFHYFWGGVAAVQAIDGVLRTADAEPPTAILDMPCGFGRVSRSLVARFPEASITACDINKRAVDFCSRQFGAEGVISSRSFEQLAFGRVFDLIWCGSLVTHLDASPTVELLDLFARSSRPGGLIIFTTHGRFIAERIRAGDDYMLPPAAATSVLAQYERSGHGYANYPWESAYGVSVISPDWIRTHLDGRAGLRQVCFAERGWGGGQDLFAFCSP
jgi:SAM-dependent methyltransferase